MKIGELARETQLTTKTIRYYEDIGLIPEPPRDRNDYRDFPDDAVARLMFIRDAQATGLTLTEIASIIELREEGRRTCDHVVALLERHLRDVDKRIRVLRESREKLHHLTRRARKLDPGNCTDPIRCQTITVGASANPTANLGGPSPR